MDNQDDGLTGARLRMDAAKQRFSMACKAVIASDPDAERLARIALAEVEVARAELRRLNEETET